MMTENIRILVLLAALALPMIVKSSDDGLNRVREALSALINEKHWDDSYYHTMIGTVYEKHLVRSYRDQRTRRLIEKLQRIGALDKAYCDDILSGKAYREYANEVSAGLWNDPLVPVWDYPIIRVAIIAASVLLAILIIVIGWLLKRYLSNK